MRAFFSANLERKAVDALPEGFVDGIYAGIARVDRSPFYPMVMSVGYNVQFDSTMRTMVRSIIVQFYTRLNLF